MSGGGGPNHVSQASTAVRRRARSAGFLLGDQGQGTVIAHAGGNNLGRAQPLGFERRLDLGRRVDRAALFLQIGVAALGNDRVDLGLRRVRQRLDVDYLDALERRRRRLSARCGWCCGRRCRLLLGAGRGRESECGAGRQDRYLAHGFSLPSLSKRTVRGDRPTPHREWEQKPPLIGSLRGHVMAAMWSAAFTNSRLARSR